MIPASQVDVLVPTRDRPDALAVTLAGLAAQTAAGFSVRVSDQSQGDPAWTSAAVRSMLRVLRRRGSRTRLAEHQPVRGMAEHRAYLLAWSQAPYVLFLDDDVWLEPDGLARLLSAMDALRCGFVGAAVQGLSYLDDVRTAEQRAYEEWPGRVVPERVRRGTAEWERWALHNAANLTHIADRVRVPDGAWRAYKVAWVGGCVLYDRAALVECGGFDFWPDVPAEHAGEDQVAQLRVMERYGGAGILPSGAVHLELPTTVDDRRVECYDVVIDRTVGEDAMYEPTKRERGPAEEDEEIEAVEDGDFAERHRVDDAMAVYSTDDTMDRSDEGNALDEEKYGDDDANSPEEIRRLRELRYRE